LITQKNADKIPLKLDIMSGESRGEQYYFYSGLK